MLLQGVMFLQNISTSYFVSQLTFQDTTEKLIGRVCYKSFHQIDDLPSSPATKLMV